MTNVATPYSDVVPSRQLVCCQVNSNVLRQMTQGKLSIGETSSRVLSFGLLTERLAAKTSRWSDDVSRGSRCNHCRQTYVWPSRQTWRNSRRRHRFSFRPLNIDDWTTRMSQRLSVPDDVCYCGLLRPPAWRRMWVVEWQLTPQSSNVWQHTMNKQLFTF